VSSPCRALDGPPRRARPRLKLRGSRRPHGASTSYGRLGLVPIQALVGLTVGGVLAAPLGAYLARKVPARSLMAAVGLLVVGLAGFQIARSLKLI
jgi:uncharacterized membrane protein YfcA